MENDMELYTVSEFHNSCQWLEKYQRLKFILLEWHIVSWEVDIVKSLRPSNFIKKETLAQVFSCEFCEICKNNFFHGTSPVAVSV